MSHLEAALWITGFCLSCALLATLTVTQRWRSEPCFTSWVAFTIATAVLLFLVLHTRLQPLYTFFYWCLAAVDLVLQIAVVFEIAKSVLMRRAAWVATAGHQFRNAAILSLIPAACLALYLRPVAESSLDAIYARCNLFMTLLVCFMFLAVVRASQRYGLAWNQHTQKLGYGLLCWNICSFITDTLHYYWATFGHFLGLEYVRIGSFQLATLYWIIVTARTDPGASQDTPRVPEPSSVSLAQYQANYSLPIE